MTELISNRHLYEIGSTKQKPTPKGYDDYGKYEAQKINPEGVVEIVAYSYLQDDRINQQ